MPALPLLLPMVLWLAQVPVPPVDIDWSKLPQGWPMWVLLAFSLLGHVLRPLGQAKVLVQTMAANTTATREAVAALTESNVHLGKMLVQTSEHQRQITDTQASLARILAGVDQTAQELLDDTEQRQRLQLERQIDDLRREAEPRKSPRSTRPRKRADV